MVPLASRSLEAGFQEDDASPQRYPGPAMVPLASRSPKAIVEEVDAPLRTRHHGKTRRRDNNNSIFSPQAREMTSLSRRMIRSLTHQPHYIFLKTTIIPIYYGISIVILRYIAMQLSLLLFII